jgi:hypothetical protein
VKRWKERGAVSYGNYDLIIIEYILGAIAFCPWPPNIYILRA